jgi:hypothetical protein
MHAEYLHAEYMHAEYLHAEYMHAEYLHAEYMHVEYMEKHISIGRGFEAVCAFFGSVCIVLSFKSPFARYRSANDGFGVGGKQQTPDQARDPFSSVANPVEE